MPADASIYSMIRPQETVPLENPLDIRARQMQLRDMMGQSQLREIQTRGALRDEETGNRVRDLFASGRPVTQEQVMAVDPLKAGPAFMKQQLDTRKATADIAKDETETRIKLLERGASILSSAKDQASYELALRTGEQTGVFSPEAISKMPTQFNPKAVEMLRNAGITEAQRLADVRAQQTQAETGRHNLAGEANAAGQLAVSRGNLGVAQGNLAETRAEHGRVAERAKAALDAGRWTNDLDRGLQVNSATGETRPITQGGAPLGNKDKPLTEGQGKASAFGMRAREAANILDSVGQDGKVQPGMIKRMYESVPIVGEGLGTMTNWTQSEAQQKVEQAQRDFINAVLRLESGATIQEAEFNNAKKQYFPQPGDSPGLIAQKKKNRETEIAGLGVMAGPGAKNIPAAPAPRPLMADQVPGPSAAAPSQADIDAELRRRKVIR